MKKIFVLLCLLLSTFSLKAQNEKVIESCELSSQISMTRSLYRDKETGRYGFCTPLDCIIVVEAKYDDVMIGTHFSDLGFTAYYSMVTPVCLNGKWGYVNSLTGNIIVPCEYDSVTLPDEHNMLKMLKNGKTIIKHCRILGSPDSEVFKIVVE